MKFKQGWGWMLLRMGMFALWLLVAVVMLWLTGVFIQGGHDIGFVRCLAFMAAGVAWLYLTAAGIREASAVTLTETGVSTRIFLRERLTPWRELRQAGILWRSSRSGHYNDLVLLRENGSLRKYRDKTFLFRNEFRFRHLLIHVPCSQETLAWITKYYGPLDFNLANGQREETQIVDVDIFQE